MTASENVPPLTVDLVVRLADMHRTYAEPGQNFAGDLQGAAERYCHYFVAQLTRFAEPRGGDMFVAVVLERGDEQAGFQYRDGQFVQPEEP